MYVSELLLHSLGGINYYIRNVYECFVILFMLMNVLLYYLCLFYYFVYFLYLIIIIYLENIRLYNIIINGNETDFKHHILPYSLIYVLVF